MIYGFGAAVAALASGAPVMLLVLIIVAIKCFRASAPPIDEPAETLPDEEVEETIVV